MLRIKIESLHRRLRHVIGNSIDDRFKLIAMSVMSVGLAVIAWATSGVAMFGPAWTAGLVLIGSFVGMVVLVMLAHGWLERHFAALKSAKLLGLGALALTTFIAHGQAVGEVNSIFQIDASALSHTTTAASAMVIGAWLFWVVFLPVLVVSFICIVWLCVKSRRGESMIAFAIFFASLTCCSLIGQQVVPELQRKSNLYQVALEMDFNSRSHCVDLPKGAEGVLFIGPDQRRAIVAPRKVVINTQGEFGAIVPQIEIPSNFQIVDCR